MSPSIIASRFRGLPAPARGAIAMVCSSLAFAMMMAIVRHLSQDLHPFEVAFFRNFIGFAVVLPWFLCSAGVTLRTERPWLHLGRAACGLSAMLCLFMAISLMPLAEVTAVTFTSPLFATAGAALVLRETVRLRRWTATLTGFAGVLIILRPGAEALAPGALLALAAAAFMASAMLFIKVLSRTEHPTTIVVYFGMLLTPMSLIPALFVWETPALHHLPWLIALGVTATVGQLLLTQAFSAADASLVMPFDFSRLIFVAIIGAVFYAELPDVWTWIGAGVIVAASAYVAHRERQLGTPNVPPAA